MSFCRETLFLLCPLFGGAFIGVLSMHFPLCGILITYLCYPENEEYRGIHMAISPFDGVGARQGIQELECPPHSQQDEKEGNQKQPLLHFRHGLLLCRGLGLGLLAVATPLQQGLSLLLTKRNLKIT